MMDEIFARIEGDIAALPRPLVVGINGAYTSGKTTFAESLRTHLEQAGHNVQLIHYDDFHHPFHTIQFTPETEIDTFYHRAFNPKKLLGEVLEPLRRDGELHQTFSCVNLGTGKFDNEVRVDINPDTVVLLEGVLLLREPILEHLGYSIYLRISPDEILRRGKLRDVPRFGAAILEKFSTRYIPVHLHYEADCRPQDIADLVIDNEHPLQPRMLSR